MEQCAWYACQYYGDHLHVHVPIIFRLIDIGSLVNIDNPDKKVIKHWYIMDNSLQYCEFVVIN